MSDGKAKNGILQPAVTRSFYGKNEAEGYPLDLGTKRKKTQKDKER